MENKVFCIVGLSGTGKTTILQKIIEKVNISNICSMTTRPKRNGEKYSIDYHYLTNKKFDFLDNQNYIVAKEEYNVATNEIWKYGFHKYILDKYLELNNVIVICTPNGVKDLKDKGYNVVSIYISVDEDERIKRILKRNDNQTKEEIKRRTSADYINFSNFSLSCDYIINNDNLENAIKQVENIINK